MQNILIALLAGIILAALIRLNEKNRQLGQLKEQARREKEETETLGHKVRALQARVSELEAMGDEVWDFANTIHLYASLSREETGQQSLKEKQMEIQQAAEHILQLTGR